MKRIATIILALCLCACNSPVSDQGGEKIILSNEEDTKLSTNVCKIALPVAMQGLITTGVNTMDSIMVGTLGETQLSAVTLANQFINIFHIFCMGIGMGASVLVARYFGAKDKEYIEDSMPIQSSEFMAMVLEDTNSDGYALIEQRNRFKLADTLEVLSPTDAFGKEIKVTSMKDEKGDSVEDASLVQQKIYLYTGDIKLTKGDILRKSI